MKVLKTTKRKEVIEIITHKTDKPFNIVETFKNGKLKDIKLTYKDNYFHPAVLNFPENWIEEMDDFYKISKYIVKDIKSIESIKDENVYFIYNNNHMLFDCNLNIFSIPTTFNCYRLQESFSGDKTYRQLVESIEKHPYFLSVNHGYVFAPNADFDSQQGVDWAKVMLPQDVCEKLYNKYKDDEKWDIKMRQEITCEVVTDIYGKEIEELLKKLFEERKQFGY